MFFLFCSACLFIYPVKLLSFTKNKHQQKSTHRPTTRPPANESANQPTNWVHYCAIQLCDVAQVTIWKQTAFELQFRREKKLPSGQALDWSIGWDPWKTRTLQAGKSEALRTWTVRDTLKSSHVNHNQQGTVGWRGRGLSRHHLHLRQPIWIHLDQYTHNSQHHLDHPVVNTVDNPR